MDAPIQRAARGVHVRILLDQTFMKESSAAFHLFKGKSNIDIRILPMAKLTGGVLHAKYFIVDGKAVFVGSQYWDWHALTQIHEMRAVVRKQRLAKTFDAAFDFDWRVASHRDLRAICPRSYVAPSRRRTLHT